jgi:folate-dependent phosphoribosylglycinamide formyltransferase PurN
VDPDWQPEDIAREVLKLEHFYYPRVIEYLLASSKI